HHAHLPPSPTRRSSDLTRGAISHTWLQKYLQEAGTSRYFVWGKRPLGMRAFPKGAAAPKFLLDRRSKTDSDFDVATGRLSWYERDRKSTRLNSSHVSIS